MRKTIILLFLLILNCSISAQSYQVSGYVMNGKHGMPNVTVSDGYTCTTTDNDGKYTITKDRNAKFIFISTPSGYITACDKGVPVFYKAIKPNQDYVNFQIKKNPKSDLKHTFYVESDVQVAAQDELEQYDSIIVNDAKKYLKQFSKYDLFGLNCGDIVGDKPELYQGYIEKSSALNIPIYRSMGNHDMQYYGRSNETSSTRYNGLFGPEYYSFNKGKLHYVVLDNCFYIGRDYFYMGYVDERQLNWLEQDLKTVPKGSTLIVIMHIPLRLSEKATVFEYTSPKVSCETVNYNGIMAMLKDYNVHFITGHMHTNDNFVYSPTMMEHNTGAACGTWWQLPGCVDGTPYGYGIYEVDGDNLTWYFKSVGYPRNYQFRTYGIGESKEFPNDIIANVWNYDSLWKVEWFENGVLMGSMQKCTGLDPYIGEKSKDTSKMKYSWIGPAPTSHLFRATPKNPNAKISVRVTDRFGNIYNENVTK